MSFTYSGDPSSSKRSAIRFAVGDTVEKGALLQDEEIDYLIKTCKNEAALMAAVFRQAATILGIRLVKRTLGPQSEDATARQQYYAAQADKYEKMKGYAGVPPTPAYASEKVFEKGMMANNE